MQKIAGAEGGNCCHKKYQAFTWYYLFFLTCFWKISERLPYQHRVDFVSVKKPEYRGSLHFAFFVSAELADSFFLLSSFESIDLNF